MSKVLSENVQAAFSFRLYDVEENGLLAKIRSHSHAPGYRERAALCRIDSCVMKNNPDGSVAGSVHKFSRGVLSETWELEDNWGEREWSRLD